VTLYEELVANGCEIGNHESDLYVRWDTVAQGVAASRNLHPALFEVEGKAWAEFPFDYDPFWQHSRR